MSTNWGRMDTQNPAIIVISAVQPAIKYIKGYKIMTRNQNTLKTSLSQAIIIKQHFKKGCKRAKNGMQKTLFFYKTEIKNITGAF